MRRVALALVGVVGLVALPLRAEEGESSDFTFKRMAVPTPGANRRITVQIDPLEAERAAARLKAEREAREAEVAEAEDDDTPPAPSDWFWGEVSPAFADAGPLNVSRALRLLDTSSDLTPPRLQHLQDIAAVHGADILMATVGTDVSPALVVALIAVESSGYAGAESEKGAKGLMQLIPDTAKRFGVEDATDPAQNIKGGVAYLAWLMEHFDRDPILALAGYNAGENAVTNNGGVPPYAETRAYVPKVLNAWRVARGLCLTPPELLTDGCVFAVNGIRTNG